MPSRHLSDEQKEDAARLRAIFDERKRANRSFTQEKLAFLCNWKTQAAVNQYMLGKIPLNLPALLKFARALEVKPSEISPTLAEQLGDFAAIDGEGRLIIGEVKAYSGTERRHADRRQQLDLPKGSFEVGLEKYRFPPVIGKGIGGPTDRNYGDGDFPAGASDQYAEVPTADPNAFITPIDEDSMYPKYPKGDYALVEPNTDIDLEDDVLVKTKDDGPILKRLLSRRGGVVRLGSYNRTDVISIPEEDVLWMYYVAFPVPAKKIKTRF